jgi:WD40 repeat protein
LAIVVVGSCCYLPLGNPPTSLDNDPGSPSYISAIAFSPNGKYLVAGSFDKQVFLWDVHSATLLRQTVLHDYHISAASFSPDGKVFACGGLDSMVSISALNGSKCPVRYRFGLGEVTSVCLFQDNQTLLVCFSSGKCVLLDAVTGARRALFDDIAVIVGKSPPELVIIGDAWGTITVCRGTLENKVHRLHRHLASCCALSLNKQPNLLVSASLDHDIVVWDLAKLKVVNSFSSRSRTARHTVITNANSVLVLDQEEAVESHDAFSGRRGYSLAVKEGLFSMAYDCTRDLVATGTRGNQVILWDGESGKERYRLIPPTRKREEKECQEEEKECHAPKG